MAANIADKFTQATNGSRPAATTLTALHSGGGTTMSCSALTGWPTATAVHFIVYTTDASGNKVAGSQTDWKGVVSGTNLINCELKAGTDSGYSIGAIVECAPTAYWAKDMADGMIAEHEQDGTHGAITPTSVVSSGPITGTVGTFSSIVVSGTATTQGWTPLGDVPDTVTANGNRNYDLVFNGNDLTSTLSPGMKLQLSRTVAAPDQCADLERGSSHYFSKTSPAGLSFTTTFSCAAWIKLESYGDTMGIITRRNADTEGWTFAIRADGRVQLVGLRIAGNNKQINSYVSVPLNRWVHVAATMDMSAADTSAQKIWLNGIEIGREYALSGTATALVQGTSALVVGAEKSDGSNPFDGKIAQAAVFSAALNDTSVRALMSQGLTGSETNLVSAFSLDNSLNDLNTSNANNLTAQNSAAATDTDSPFANAVTAGTLEYAEINSVSFSTNTTVNVRVPDTCMIPTSGGVSSVYYSTQSNPYGLPYFSKIIGYAQIMSNFTTSSATDTQVLGLTCPVVVPTGAKVKVTFFASNLANATTTTIATATVYNGTPGSGTKLDEILTPMVSGIGNAGNSVYIVYTPASGANTFNAGMRTTGGTVTVAGATTAPSYLQVELV